MTDDLQALSDAAEKLLRVWPMQKAREAARVELADALAASPSPDTDREPIDGPKCWTCGKPCGHVYAQPIDRESPDTDAGLDVERLSIAMNRAYTYGTGTAEQVAAEYARLATPDKDQPEDHRHGALCANGWCDEDDGGLR